jgi:N-acetylmuramoyl-L-alanine amidase
MVKSVAISAGHYPQAKGAYNKTYGLHEHDLCYGFALNIVALLKDLDIPTLLVPTGTLSKKVTFINKNNCLFAVEVHLNSAKFVATGTECLFYSRSELGKVLAQTLQVELVDALKLRNRGVVPRKKLTFLSRTVCPAVLTESLFLNNDEEVELYLLNQSGKDKIVNAHVKAIKDYYERRIYGEN